MKRSWGMTTGALLAGTSEEWNAGGAMEQVVLLEHYRLDGNKARGGVIIQ